MELKQWNAVISLSTKTMETNIEKFLNQNHALSFGDIPTYNTVYSYNTTSLRPHVAIL